MSMRSLLQSTQLMGIIYIVAADTLFKVTQAPENTNSIVGTNIAFNCTFPSVPDDSNVNIYWWKLGEKELIQPGSDSRKRFNNEKGRASFQLLNVSVLDSGVYYCLVTLLGDRAENGSGSKLVVSAPPTPLRIVSKASETNVSGSFTLVCEMAAFYPEGLTTTWYKNDRSLEIGIRTTKQLTRAGMYEASSYFEETQPVQGGTVYVCLVSHVTLQIPAMAIYLVPNSSAGSDSTSPSPYLRIIGLAGFALAFLVLVITIGMSFRLSNCKGKERKDEANICEESNMQTAVDNPMIYAAVILPGSKKNGKPRRKEKSTEYSEMKTIH